MVRKKSVGMKAASTPAKINASVASDRQSWICDLYEAPSMNREHESMWSKSRRKVVNFEHVRILNIWFSYYCCSFLVFRLLFFSFLCVCDCHVSYVMYHTANNHIKQFFAICMESETISGYCPAKSLKRTGRPIQLVTHNHIIVCYKIHPDHEKAELVCLVRPFQMFLI